MSDLATKQKGFSLVELLVAISIFTVVLTIAVSTLLVLVDANGKAQNMQEAMTNLTFAMDSMTREIRTGSGYYCSSSAFENEDLTTSDRQDCPVSSQGIQISFIEAGNSLTAGGSGQGSSRISYRFNSNDGRIYRQIGNGDFLPLTTDDLTITDMRFIVTGTDSFNTDNDTVPPLVTIFIKGQAGDLQTIDTSFQLQTTVVQRAFDI